MNVASSYLDDDISCSPFRQHHQKVILWLYQKFILIQKKGISTHSLNILAMKELKRLPTNILSQINVQNPSVSAIRILLCITIMYMWRFGSLIETTHTHTHTVKVAIQIRVHVCASTVCQLGGSVDCRFSVSESPVVYHNDFPEVKLQKYIMHNIKNVLLDIDMVSDEQATFKSFMLVKIQRQGNQTTNFSIGIGR